VFRDVSARLITCLGAIKKCWLRY